MGKYHIKWLLSWPHLDRSTVGQQTWISLYIFMFAPCISSIKNTFYCSNWCTLL